VKDGKLLKAGKLEPRDTLFTEIAIVSLLVPFLLLLLVYYFFQAPHLSLPLSLRASLLEKNAKTRVPPLYLPPSVMVER
jgi:hypothetical protein